MEQPTGGSGMAGERADVRDVPPREQARDDKNPRGRPVADQPPQGTSASLGPAPADEGSS